MRIESIKLQGFKSFREEAILTFLQKITAVVGPNGVGKSNIADAFAWVLGEQSLKSLRTQESTDVIFAGSQTQSKLSRAVVTVKFGMEKSDALHQAASNKDEDKLSRFSEIEITRKIYSSGESFYFLNQAEVRLLDIQLLLAQYNVGQKNYAVIGQGMIDEILRRSPRERLDFFYEATGVKKYQIKLHRARLKLIKSQERLNQTKTLLKEITPHKKYLAAQAEKYLQRKAILEDLLEKQTTYYKQAFGEIKEAYRNKKLDFQQIENQQQQMDQAVEGLEKQINSLKKVDTREEYQKLSSQLAKSEIQKRHLRDEIDALERAKEDKLIEQGQLDLAFFHRRRGEVEDLSNNLRGELAALDSLQQALQDSLDAKNREQQELGRRREALASQEKNITPAKLLSYLRGLLELTRLEIIKSRISFLIDQIEATHQVDKLAEIEQVKQELSAEIHELRIKLPVLEEKRKILQEAEDRYQNELSDLQLKLQRPAAGANNQWLNELLLQQEKYQAGYDKLAEDIKHLGQQINLLNQQEEERRLKFYDWQRQYREALDQQRHVSELWQAVKIELARLEFKCEQLKEEMQEHLPEAVVAMIVDEKLPAARSVDIDLKALRGEVRRLRGEAASLGEVEESVLKEYEEIKGRYDFLNEQSTDLEEAINSLHKITRRLQRRIKRQFRERFKDLNKDFQRYFKILFGGGQAEIKQVDIEEVGDDKRLVGQISPGIEIVAHPPGKKIKHTMTLSGGEKSLVTVALICAIISSNPPPFVILDEIDASLDEANSNRLAQILKKLSANTQLIIITHNRSTMEIADVLYGVSMDEEGVSRLFGVKLEDYK